MTVSDRILLFVGFTPNNPNLVLASAMDQGIDPTLVYTSDMRLTCLKAALDLLKILLSTPDVQNSIDGVNQFKTTYDRTAIQAQIALLKAENGLEDKSKPYIDSRPIW